MSHTAINLNPASSATPCRGCDDRKAGCHSLCPLYISFKEEVEKVRRERAQTMEINYMLSSGVRKWRTEDIKKRQKKGR